MKSHVLAAHDYCTGSARPKVARRASGWFDWFCLTSLGEKIEGVGGFEKSRPLARKLAGAAARAYNARARRGNQEGTMPVTASNNKVSDRREKNQNREHRR